MTWANRNGTHLICAHKQKEGVPAVLVLLERYKGTWKTNKRKNNHFSVGKVKQVVVKTQNGSKSKLSLSSIPSRCIIRKTRAFCSEGYFFLVHQIALFMMVPNYYSPCESQSFCTSSHSKYNTSFACILSCRCNWLPRHHSLYSICVEVLKSSSGVYDSLFIKPSKVSLTKHTSTPMQNTSQ